LTLHAYRFALDPTPTQERLLRSHCGAVRVAFNWGLARVKAVMGQREAEATYGVSKEDLTPAVSWSLYSLRKEWNVAKADVAPWWGECSKEAFNTGLDGLARSLKNWGDCRSGKRKGAPVGFPRFKSRHRSRLSVRFTTGAIRCETKHAVLPRLGRIKMHEDASGLVGRVDAGDARVMSAAVRFDRGRWFVSFTVEVQRPVLTSSQPDAVVGVDLGIKTLAVLSTGEVIDNPRHLSSALRKVRRLSRTASRRAGPYDSATKKRRPPSNRWRQATAALGKAQGRVADQRKDSIHKLTTRLARQYGTVVVEDLNVAGMVRNHCLARHVADASFGQIRRQLEYKTTCNGGANNRGRPVVPIE
jgi:IS605 OrfB family transposase